MNKRVYDGYRAARAFADEIMKGWFELIPQSFDDVPDAVYGGDVEYTVFKS